MKLQLYYSLKPSICTQKFGVNDGADYPKLLGTLGHPGRDFANIGANGINLSMGLGIRAACDGVISSVETDTNGGHTVVQVTDKAYDYEDGQSYFKIVYAHCLAGSIIVKKGDKVKIGYVLALCGSSGVQPNAATEDPKLAHLHFAIKPATYYGPIGIEPEWWGNTEQSNGYAGAIDDTSYETELYAEDYVTIQAAKEVVDISTEVVQEIKNSSELTPVQKYGFLETVMEIILKVAAILEKII